MKILSKLLLSGVVIMPIIAWQNWAGNINCNTKVLYPKNKKELIKFILDAKKENKTLRAFGTGHSWSDVVCNNGYIINTDKLSKIISVDKKTNHVRVEAGIKLHQLNKELAKLNLCLSNQGAISAQSLAGAISTATHGSGKTGTLASFISEVQLATADGKLINFSENKNKLAFSSVRTSIGSLGIMTELTIKCEPLFKIRRERQTIKWDDFLNNYNQLYKNNDYIEFYWIASSDLVDVKIHNRIPIDFDIKIKKTEVDYSYKLLSGVLEEKYLEEEIAVPAPKFVEAAKVARNLVLKNLKNNEMFDGILFRFVKADLNNHLSPANNQDVIFFSITTSSTKGYESFYKNFYRLMIKFDGRPHWGKINYLTNKDAQKLYGKDFDQFIKLRKKLDPTGLFSNDFTKKIFGW